MPVSIFRLLRQSPIPTSHCSDSLLIISQESQAQYSTLRVKGFLLGEPCSCFVSAGFPPGTCGSRPTFWACKKRKPSQAAPGSHLPDFSHSLPLIRSLRRRIFINTPPQAGRAKPGTQSCYLSLSWDRRASRVELCSWVSSAPPIMARAISTNFWITGFFS